ncbi:hypothetical protein NQ306_19895, partial [Escherichia coli]|nr:hypothetical protein [Escherichia coli]MDW6366846.1 hypothetical protein [Escherichia coli]
MKKIIIFTIIAIITFSWLVTHNTTESEKIPPANTPFIIKSNVPGMCKVSAITTSTDTKLKWFTEFGHLNRGDMLTSEQHRCHNE